MKNDINRLAQKFEAEHPEFKNAGYILFACSNAALEAPSTARFEILGRSVIAR